MFRQIAISHDINTTGLCGRFCASQIQPLGPRLELEQKQQLYVLDIDLFC